VSLRHSKTLPLHPTASGQAYLAFAPPKTLQDVLAQPLASFTAWTASTPDNLREAAQSARTNGFAVVDKSYDDDVYCVAVPVFGGTTTAIGALAITSPSHRMTAAAKALILK
jgi:IclR family transcriptional regulator, acetate operon repressor